MNVDRLELINGYFPSSQTWSTVSISTQASLGPNSEKLFFSFEWDPWLRILALAFVMLHVTVDPS